MENKKKKKLHRQVKVSAKTKVITKGTAYFDKKEASRRQRMATSGAKRGITSAAINKLSQKHSKLSLEKVPGLAMTKAQKKRLLKKQARAEKFAAKERNAEMVDPDWESASSDDEAVKE